MKRNPAQARQAAAAALVAFSRKEISADQLKAVSKEVNAATRAMLKPSSEHVKK